MDEEMEALDKNEAWDLVELKTVRNPITNDDLRTVREAVDSEDGKLWEKAMDEEMKSLDKNEALDLVEFPYGRKAIGNKWVFKNKLNAESKQEVLPSKEEPEKIEFESNSIEEQESEEEAPHTPVLRRSMREKSLLKRYTPFDFHSIFSLFVIHDDSIILERQWIQRMENSGKKPWLKKWKPWIRMRLWI